MAAVAKTNAGEDLSKSISAIIDELGGMDSFVSKGDSVFVKPNFNSADPFPASTDPHFLECVVRLLLQHEPKQIIVGESSAFHLDTSKTLAKMGIPKLSGLSPVVQVIDLDQTAWVQKRIPEARYLRKVHIPAILDEVDKLILLPCLKTHNLAQFTGSLKLSVAFMRPRERLSLHVRNLQQKVAELNTLIHPDLVIMDARKCFISGGPSSGVVREPNLLMASADRLALDLAGIRLIQSYEGNSLATIVPEDLPQIARALEMGIGLVARGENVLETAAVA